MSYKIQPHNQQHLSYHDTINLGSYYTNSNLVKIVFNLLEKHINNIQSYIIMDTSCGYGSFLENNNCKYIGADIDKQAIEIAKDIYKNTTFFCGNSLNNVSRDTYDLNNNDKIIIIGNPPYNDTTSIIKNNIKTSSFEIDKDLKTRDLGMSFLLSYNKLNADYVCILHPLSYLIKKSNFNLLKNFANNYKLMDSIIISSNEFSHTSKHMSFPIIIALYKKDHLGMTYPFISNYLFKTIDSKQFKLNQFENIDKYISKYPNQNSINHKDAIAMFWTLRDINALKRSKTFVDKITENTIFITEDKLDYYCYIDIFKEYTKHIPYYLGNCDIMINNQEFQTIKKLFRFISLKKHPNLHHLINHTYDEQKARITIDNYFKNLLGEHFVY
jgi:hypothetical protein